MIPPHKLSDGNLTPFLRDFTSQWAIAQETKCSFVDRIGACLEKPFIVGLASERFSAGIRRRFTDVVRYLSIAVSRTVNCEFGGHWRASGVERYESVQNWNALLVAEKHFQNSRTACFALGVTRSQRSPNCGTGQLPKILARGMRAS
jgi:hypothetical protein